jgi:hypothetical protein
LLPIRKIKILWYDVDGGGRAVKHRAPNDETLNPAMTKKA